MLVRVQAFVLNVNLTHFRLQYIAQIFSDSCIIIFLKISMVMCTGTTVNFYEIRIFVVKNKLART